MKNSRLVYSTETGRIRHRELSNKPGGDGTIIIRHDKKGRRGKGVTILSGFIISLDQLKKLAKTLKQRCSSGGTVKDGVIEIQGDHTKILEQNLLELGYKTKSSQT